LVNKKSQGELALGFWRDFSVVKELLTFHFLLLIRHAEEFADLLDLGVVAP
jgi:hypothetical protein